MSDSDGPAKWLLGIAIDADALIFADVILFD